MRRSSAFPTRKFWRSSLKPTSNVLLKWKSPPSLSVSCVKVLIDVSQMKTLSFQFDLWSNNISVLSYFPSSSKFIQKNSWWKGGYYVFLLHLRHSLFFFERKKLHSLSSCLISYLIYTSSSSSSVGLYVMFLFGAGGFSLGYFQWK